MILDDNRIAPYRDLLSHSRFLLTLRSQQGDYHSLILFRLSSGMENNTNQEHVTRQEDEVNPAYKQLYAGADMSHAEIEECENSVVAVCPWHRCVRGVI